MTERLEHIPTARYVTRAAHPGLSSALTSGLTLLNSLENELGTQLLAPGVTAEPPAAQHDITFQSWVRDEYKRRQQRGKFFNQNLFMGEPCWDILLDLTLAYLEGRKIYVSSACIASGVPPTTALRWLKILEDEGLAVRMPDKQDRRKSSIAVTDRGFQSLEAYFQKCILGQD